MKRILVFCGLYLITMLTYADTCRQPEVGYIFRVAAWGDHVGSTSQVRCHYYDSKTGTKHKEIWTNRWYEENSLENNNWHSSGDRYYLCTSDNVNDCQFGRT